MDFFHQAICRIKQEINVFIINRHLPNYYRQQNTTKIIIPAPVEDYCEIVVVAFNNHQVIDYQIRCLKKFFKTPFRYTVFDNSTNKEVCQSVQSVCRKHMVGYVKLPSQLFLPKGYVSYSHGIALNYICKNYLVDSLARYVMFLDHDIFPMKNFRVEKYISSLQPCYGLVHHRSTKGAVYIWPGFYLQDLVFLKEHNIELDFRPSIRLRGDTGVSNYPILFQYLNIDKFPMVKETHVTMDETHDITGMGYSWFDCGWLHCWNASNYALNNRTPEKMKLIYDLLEKKLR